MLHICQNSNFSIRSLLSLRIPKQDGNCTRKNCLSSNSLTKWVRTQSKPIGQLRHTPMIASCPGGRELADSIWAVSTSACRPLCSLLLLLLLLLLHFILFRFFLLLLLLLLLFLFLWPTLIHKSSSSLALFRSARATFIGNQFGSAYRKLILSQIVIVTHIYT